MFTLKIRFQEHLINADSLHPVLSGNVVSGYALRIRLGYYRSLALSCISRFELHVDGQPVPSDQILFGLNGKQFTIGQLPDLYAEYWYLLDEAELLVTRPGGLSEGGHEIALTMELRSPYMLTGPNRAYATIDSSDTRTVVLQGRQG